MTNKEAIEELKGLQEFINGTRLKGEIRAEAFDLAIKALEQRPQGEWILPNFYGDGVSYECGNCHIPHEGYIGKDGKPHGYDYCPNCGAKMEGGAE